MQATRYVWSAGRGTVMHIARYNAVGECLCEPLCGSTRLPWNRTINAPFGLGKRICKNCRAVAAAS